MNLKDTIRIRTEQINFTFKGRVEGEQYKEVMRITREGIWVDPEMNVEDAAQFVLDALNDKIKLMVKLAVEDEREQCATLCEALVNAENETGKVDHNEIPWTQACAMRIRAMRIRARGKA